jgi:hypothetical protein
MASPFPGMDPYLEDNEQMRAWLEEAKIGVNGQ